MTIDQKTLNRGLDREATFDLFVDARGCADRHLRGSKFEPLLHAAAQETGLPLVWVAAN